MQDNRKIVIADEIIERGSTDRRHDISDAAWNLLELHLPGREGAWGGKAGDNRLSINAVSGFYGAARRGAICGLKTR